MKLIMCRICLVENVPMQPIAKTHLQEIYEKLTTMKLETNTSRPIIVCYMCYARLRNCYHLRNSCLHSEKMLTLMFSNDIQGSPSKSKAVTNLNFLTITPVVKISLCDVVHERDVIRSAMEEGLKMEATLTEEIDVKIEPVDISDAEEYIATQIQNADVLINMEGGENFSAVDDCAPTRKIILTSSISGSSKREKTENAEIKNKEDKCNINEVIGTQILEDKKVHKLCNKTKRQKKSFKCDVCCKQFNRKSHLVKHFRIHNKCDVCNKQFNRQSHLIMHLRTHTGEKPYKCDLCNAQFNRKYTLVTHLRSHTGEKPHKCNICNKHFSLKSTLVRHLRIHTGEKPYRCDVCNKQFSQRKSLVFHCRIHTGEKPYKCDICNRQFSDDSNLIKHIHRHTGKR